MSDIASGPLPVGAKAPRFSLRRTFEETVSLEDLNSRGPAVVVFYVFDFGNICSHEVSQFGARIGEIRRLGVEVVAIAVTATFSQMAFAETLGIDFPLLSDWEGTASADYGVRYDTWKGHRGLSKRSVFVIDREGYITYAWSNDDALTLPEFDEVMDAIAAVAEGP